MDEVAVVEVAVDEGGMDEVVVVASASFLLIVCDHCDRLALNERSFGCVLLRQ